MAYQLRYSIDALRNLKELEKRTANRILHKLRFFAQQEKPLQFAKRLTNFACGTYRFRVGNFRVLFDIDKEGNIDILYILSIKHRKEAYK